MASPALRRKQVRAAELVGTGLAYAEAGAVVGRSERTVARWLEDPDLRAIATREGALAGDLGLAGVLRGALWATKANGQPDWPTRVSAARALEALRLEELEAKEEKQSTEPSIVVYDLPPGATPVLHRAREGADASLTPADAEPALDPTSWRHHLFDYESPEGETVAIGTWFPPDHGRSELGSEWAVHRTGDREKAERWRAELSAGRLPVGGDEVPEGHEAPGSATRS